MSYEAIARGALDDGEVCEISGIGPVPLEVAGRLAADSILRVLVTKGGQPMAVTPGLRTIPRALRLLLEARDRTCVVPGCDVSFGLQIDHRKDFHLLGPTDLENCARLCKYHHDLKSYGGWHLQRNAEGSWAFSPPDDYRDPEPVDPALGEMVLNSPWTGRPAGASAEGPGAAGSGIADAAGPAATEGYEGERARQLALVGAVGAGPAP